MKQLLFIFLLCFAGYGSIAQDIKNNPGSNHGNRFEQLGTMLPTANEYRTASGAPGPKYWQQRCDYDITCELDEPNRKLTGKETLTYYNNSPDVLTYLWLQLDENQHSKKNNSGFQTSNFMQKSVSEDDIKRANDNEDKYGHNITKVTNALGTPLKYTINKTMMRIELPQPLKPGQQFVFKIDWNYFISDRMQYGGRGGYEHFPEDGNDLFTMTQWFPRMCVYSDFQGWQNHQFVGSGEFALTFGNYKVAITVPADHVVMATGEGQNYAQVLSATEMARWQKAQTAKDVVEIVTLAEATAKEKKKSTQKKTWIYKANMVRDFAWGSSRKFVWDAMPITVEGKKVMCMSGYGKEAYNLYRKYSTKVVAHTIKTYSNFSIPYPYPVAQSLEAANGMEYPMICFNFGRCEKDGTYSEGTKNGMIGVIIHEVGHNFFPMIINSDERQWTWMDEGLNSFLEYLSEELWDNKFPSSKGAAYKIVDYMKMPKDQLEPIMTNSENIIMFGPNAYSKPATGLNILRETIMGRELFDYAFKEYARRWAFKHPTPADLFRTMEDASAVDLDWFWRGWFFGTDACDISLDTVKWANLDPQGGNRTSTGRNSTQAVAKPILNSFDDISKIRNREDKKIVFAVDADTSLRDFYWRYARDLVKVDPTPHSVNFPANTDTLTNSEKQDIAGSTYMYELTFSNKGGLVMPLIIEWTYKDGSKEINRIDAQVWRKNENKVTKSFIKNKEVASVKLDPMRETADINESNNTWNVTSEPSKFQLFKSRGRQARGAGGGNNPMQKEIK
ncbi:MAG TPA: M1 family metallopeptidase [Ferruginibacter sp.]|nr:M1 family metallopeptidase [Ferruginibacter sp.]HRE64116.1 M1 family metallopeptidase [Ferruginibacter sp.]